MTDMNDVLIVDNDEVTREQLMGLLDDGASRLFFAADGQKAMEVFDKEEINVLVVDINLPDANGFDLLKRCKQKKPYCEVIITSSARNHEIAVQSLRKGAADYLQKPFEMDELFEAVDRAQQKVFENGQTTYKSTILVIDDEEQIAKRIQKFLEKEGFHVFIAFNGKDGLNVIENNKIEVLLTDIKMNGMDGIEVLNRAKLFSKDIEGIMITGYKEEDLAKKALRTGAIDYLTKPLDLDELLTSINQAVKKRRENKFREMALYDNLTNLPNRVLFLDRLRQAITLSKRYDHMLALLFLDLDRFKKVNDTLGHLAGDMLLKETAFRLIQCVRESDTVARMGGDEFTVILSQICSENDAAVVAKKITGALNREFDISGNVCHIGTSIGISTYPADGESPEVLLKRADAAMYAVKEKGRNDYQFYGRKA